MKIKAQNGLTLLEASVVLALSLIVIGVATQGWTGVKARQEVTAMVQQQTELMDVIKATYPNKIYDDLTVAALTAKSDFNDRWRVSSGGALLAADGGRMSVAPTTLNEGYDRAANSSVAFDYFAVNARLCNEFVTAIADSVPYIEVQSVMVKHRYTNGGKLNSSTLTAQCALIPSGASIRVIRDQ